MWIIAWWSTEGQKPTHQPVMFGRRNDLTLSIFLRFWINLLSWDRQFSVQWCRQLSLSRRLASRRLYKTSRKASHCEYIRLSCCHFSAHLLLQRMSGLHFLLYESKKSTTNQFKLTNNKNPSWNGAEFGTICVKLSFSLYHYAAGARSPEYVARRRRAAAYAQCAMSRLT